MKKPNVGIVDLADLSWARPWSTRRHDLWLELGIEPGVDDNGEPLSWESWTSREPCPTMVALVTSNGLGPYASRWLQRAANVVLVVDTRDRGPADADPDLVALEHDELTKAMGVPTTLVRWDGSHGKTADVHAALATAAAATSSSKSPHDARAPNPRKRLRCAPGPWIETAFPRFERLRIASHTYARNDAVLLALDLGVVVDLRTGASVVDAPPLLGTIGDRYALSPDGRNALAQTHMMDVDAPPQAGTFLVDLDPELEGRRMPVPPYRDRASLGGVPFAFLRAGATTYAAVGHRTTFSWLTIVDDKIVPLASSAHDWPCGHAKKLWGYADNTPCELHVGDDEQAYVSMFEHDVLVASSVPLRWRRAARVTTSLSPQPSQVAAAVCDPPDSLRRLFFVPDWSRANLGVPGAVGGDDVIAGHPTDDDATDEDVRSAPPAIAVGPNDELRYVVGLDRETWFIDERGRPARLGGPDDGYVVCDASHVVVRRGRGRLLCGTTRTLFVLDDGRLVRESLKTGKREDVGAEDVAIERAHALHCSDNAVLVAVLPGDADDRVRVRLV